MRLLVVLLLAFASALGAAERCDVPPRYAGLSREALKDRLKESPDDFTLNRLFVDSATYENLAERARYSALLRQHPGSIDYQYLQARSLVGTNSKEALRIYGQILEKDPDYPWVHLSQLGIFKAEGFLDRKKLQASFEAFTRVCPSSIAPYHYLDQIPDHELAVRAAAKLRMMLKSAKIESDLAAYSVLWKVELQALPIEKDGDEKRQIAEDLKPLMPLEKLATIQMVIANGAFLAGDRELNRRIAAEHRALNDEFRAWGKTHRFPKPDAPDDVWDAFNEAKLAESTKLLEMAPGDYLGYMVRFEALDATKKASAEDLLRTGNEYAGSVFRRDDESPTPALVERVESVPANFRERGIHLDRVPALIEEIVERLNNDLLPVRREPDQRMTRVSQSVGSLWDLVQTYQKLGENEKAHHTVRRMEAMVAANQPPADTARRQILKYYSSSRAQLWQCKAKLAEQEGRKLDALIAYREAAIAVPAWGKVNLEAERKLWTELGGTDEGWTQWVAAIPGEPVKPAPATVEETWIRKLPEMSLTDFAGNQWTLDRFKGKTVVAVVWATWCGFCMQELPYFATLSERLKGRDDVIAISFNVDDNLGSAEAVFKRKEYRFPALAAKQYAEDLMGDTGIPRTWIIKNGAIVYEAEGFDPKNDKWVDQMLARLK